MADSPALRLEPPEGFELTDGYVHRFELLVQFDEVDIYSMVHHSRYFIYLERARVELMGLLGMEGGTMEEAGMGLIVVGAQVRYRTPARFLDHLVVEQGCAKAGASRIELIYRVLRGDAVILTAALTLAFVDPTGKPCRAPATIRDGLRKMGVPG